MRLTAQQQQEGLALLGRRPEEIGGILRLSSQAAAEGALKAFQEACSRGFRAASLRYHPDRYEAAPGAVRAENEHLFKLANVVNQWVQNLRIERRAGPVVRRPVPFYSHTVIFGGRANTTTNTTTFATRMPFIRMTIHCV